MSRDAAKAAGNDPAPAAKPDIPPGFSSSQSNPAPDQVADPARAKKDAEVGGFYLKKGDYQGALRRYQDAMAADPTNVDAIFGLAETQHMLKKNADAARNYQLYLEIVPNGPKAKQAMKALKTLGPGIASDQSCSVNDGAGLTFWFSLLCGCFTLPRSYGELSPMHAVLERVVNQISSERCATWTRETTQLHPKGLVYKWNAQQVVEHLVLGYRLTTEALETRLNKGRLSRNQNRTYLQWTLQLMILTFGTLPRGVPALDETMPKPGHFPP